MKINNVVLQILTVVVFCSLAQNVFRYTGVIGCSTIELVMGWGKTEKDIVCIYLNSRDNKPILLVGVFVDSCRLLLRPDKPDTNSPCFLLDSFTKGQKMLTGLYKDLPIKDGSRADLKLEFNYCKMGISDSSINRIGLLQLDYTREHFFRVLVFPSPMRKSLDCIDARVGEIQVFSRKTGLMVQHFECEGAYASWSSLRFDDFNFDGYIDFVLAAPWPRHLGSSDIYFIFDSKSKEYRPLDLHLCDPQFNRENKTVTSTCLANTPGLHSKVIKQYLVINGKFRLFRETCFDQTADYSHELRVPCR